MRSLTEMEGELVRRQMREDIVHWGWKRFHERGVILRCFRIKILTGQSGKLMYRSNQGLKAINARTDLRVESSLV